jgi:hypothetical protein
MAGLPSTVGGCSDRRYGYVERSERSGERYGGNFQYLGVTQLMGQEHMKVAAAVGSSEL